VVEVQDDWIGFSAVDTGVRLEVSVNEILDVPAIHTISMDLLRFVCLIIIGIIYLLAITAIYLTPVFARGVECKRVKAFDGIATRTQL
jgi:hypothetical protein